MRLAISMSMVEANAPMADATRNTAITTRNVRRWPNAATSQAFSSMPTTMVAR